MGRENFSLGSRETSLTTNNHSVTEQTVQKSSEGLELHSKRYDAIINACDYVISLFPQIINFTQIIKSGGKGVVKR